MAEIINTNIASLRAQRQLSLSQAATGSALQRLSSGLRINSAKDDAAGLAISTRFDAQIKGSNQAIRNAGDAISLAQTAGGALSSITTNLQRIRELALQSANATNTSIDRTSIQTEVDQLRAEIKNVADTTNFNGKKLLNGSFSNEVFQTGANQGDTIKVSIAKLSTDSLGTTKTAGLSSENSATALTGTTSKALVAGDLVLNGIAIQGSVGTSDNASTYDASSSAIAKAAAINQATSQTGITATVDANTVAGTAVSATAVAGVSKNISINNISIALTTASTLSTAQNLTNVANAINLKTGQTGVTASFNGDIATGVTLTAADGRNIALGATTSGTTQKFGLATTTATSLTKGSLQSTFIGTYNLASQGGKDITITSNTGDVAANAGFEVGTFSGSNAGIVGGAATTTALSTGDLVINGIAVGASLASSDTASTASASGSAIAKVAAINAVSGQTGVTAVVNENQLNSLVTTGSTGGSVVLNGVTVTTSFQATDTIDVVLKNTIAAFNNVSGQTGVTAQALDATHFTLVAKDGRNIAVGASAVASSGLTSSTTTVGSFALQSAGKIDISSNTPANLTNAGLREGSFGGAQTGTLLSNIDVTTAASAANAVTAVDNALQTISSNQANIGAIQNRFTNTISNLSSTSINLTAANSRTKDADFAKATADLSRAQVLQQAGISILRQANALPKQVLSLLR